MSNIDTAKQMYEAFGRGDSPAIIDKLDPNVEWDVEVPTPGVPWLQPRHGAGTVDSDHGRIPAAGAGRTAHQRFLRRATLAAKRSRALPL